MDKKISKIGEYDFQVEETKVEEKVKETKDDSEIKKFDQMFEDHMIGREAQIMFICDNINELNDNDIEYIYNHIEAKLGYSADFE